MNIIHIYRKIIEKSRSLGAHAVDHFLFIAALVVLAVFIFVNLSFRTVNDSRRIDLFISAQCENLFGKDAIDTLIREFEEQNPELSIRLADQAPPDIVFFDEGQFGGMVNSGALVSLAPYIHTESGANQWAIPLASFMDLFLYNIDILKAVNFDRPPKTRVEFLNCVRAIANLNSDANANVPADGGSAANVAASNNAARSSGVYGFALGLNDPLAIRRDVFSWIWAAGGEIRPPETAGQKPELSRPAEEIIGFFGQLNREGLLSPGTFDKTGAERIDEFAQGTIAMMTASARDLPLLKKHMPASSFGITVIPGAITQGKTRLGLSGIYAGINSECARLDEAWSFLAFLAEKSPALSAALGAVPGSLPAFPGISAFPGSYIVEDPLYSKAWDIFEAADIVEGFSGHPHGAEAEQAVREKLLAAFGEH